MAITTPNLSLQVPVVGDTSPSYTTSITNTCNTLDVHDHSSGKGVPVKANTLTWAGQVVDVGAAQMQSLATARFSDQAAANALPAASYPRGLFTVGGDLFYNTGYGTQMQITQNGALNGALVGGIAGSYATSGASINYNSSSKVYTFLDQNAVNAGIVALNGVFTNNVITSGTLTSQGAATVASLTVNAGSVAIPSTTKTYRVSPLRGFWPNGVSTAPAFPNPPIRVAFPASSTGRWYVCLPTPNFGYIASIRIRMYCNGTMSGGCYPNQNSVMSGATNNVAMGPLAWPASASGDFVVSGSYVANQYPCSGYTYWVDFGATQGSTNATVTIVGIEFDVVTTQLPDTLV